MSPIQNKPGPFRALRGPFGHCHLPTSETCIGLFPTTLPQGRFSTGSQGFSEMRYLRLGAQKASLRAHGAVTPGVAWPAGSCSSPLLAFPSPQVPLLVAACASAALVLRWWLSRPGLGLCCPIPLSLLAVLASYCPRGLQGGGGLARGLSTDFLLCVRLCVPFRAPGLTLRVWRVVTTVRLTNSGPGAGPSRTCSPPAPCQPPSPTASLALRASLCSGMCALALPACLPPSPQARSRVPG